ncbi:FtsX-like permease family protein [Mobilicoccus massiliensis]|uniref:FtsX-like permease family protein n=1 Tax=Mobilicoccus massiliensis TaxID=1522310 RepID=UPI00059022B6|nr:FtsX-like permease family protein [Mobilicoccus massiliensis]
MNALATPVSLAWRLARHERRDTALPTMLSITAFAVTTAAILVTLGGVGAFESRAVHSSAAGHLGQVYLVLAYTAAVLLVVPILTLGSVAVRLTVSRRDARLATLRLVGATNGQVTVMTLAEQAVQAAVGAVAGAALYGVLLVPLSSLSFQGRHLSVAELWVGPLELLLVMLGVIVLAVLAGVSGLARVVVGPLGVVARTTPARLSIVRVLVAAAVVAVWVLGFTALGEQGMGVALGFLALVVLMVNVVGPFLVMVAGHIVAWFARTPATLLAARRIVDDPKATWRSVSALALGILVAALSSVGPMIASGDASEAEIRVLGEDIGTGSLVALTILTVVAATSTGVVHAARVYDQRPQYRALAYAGAPLPLLHRARLREVTIPVLVTVALGATFPLLILLPLTALIGIGLVVRTVVAVAVACALLVAAVLASRTLVDAAARL